MTPYLITTRGRRASRGSIPRALAALRGPNRAHERLDSGREDRVLAVGVGQRVLDLDVGGDALALDIHAAGDGSHADWTWYVDTLIGTPYIAHILNPQFQTARVVVEDANHPATRDLPSEWMHEEEWYSWERSPRGAGMHVLVTVDEHTYSPEIAIAGREQDLRMGDDHPMVWTSCVGRGRTIYAGFGHQAEAYETDTFRALFEGAIAWAARVEGDGCS